MYSLTGSSSILFGIEVAQFRHVSQQINLGNRQVEIAGGVDVGFPRHTRNRANATKNGGQVRQGYAEMGCDITHDLVVSVGTFLRYVHQANAWIVFSFIELLVSSVSLFIDMLS